MRSRVWQGPAVPGRVVAIVAAAALLAAFAVPNALAGCPDSDGDTVCDDVDNCPADPNPTQADLDGDGDGDVCDPADATLTVLRLILKSDSSPVVDNSRVTLKGETLTTPPGDTISAADGITLRVADRLGYVLVHHWPASACNQAGQGIVCITPDRRKITIKPINKTPQVVRFSAKAKAIGLSGVADRPVTVTLGHGAAIDRAGEIDDCLLTNLYLKCREF